MPHQPRPSLARPRWQRLVPALVFTFGAGSASTVWAQADTSLGVGEVMFATAGVWAESAQGTVRVVLPTGARVHEGMQVLTAPDGLAYLRMDDGAVVVIRPGSRLLISDYRVDAQQVERSLMRLELKAGQARVITGEGGKRAPQRFRFNTPLLAIGIRGTDFTAATSAERSRVFIQQGAIVAARIGPDCAAAGVGPCPNGQPLTVADREVLLARSDSPTVYRQPMAGNTGSATPGAAAPGPVETEPMQRPVTEPVRTSATTTTLPAAPVTPPPQHIHWGRWQALAEWAATPDVGSAVTAYQGFFDGALFAMWRTQAPGPGLAGRVGTATYGLAQHESYLLTRKGSALSGQAVGMSHSSLTIDFSQRSFTTALTATHAGTEIPLRAAGTVDGKGQLLWTSTGSNMSVKGLTAGPSAEQAGYIYNRQLSQDHWVQGATLWNEKKP